MRKSLLALATFAAAAGDVAMASTRRSCDSEFGHERRALNVGGLFTNTQSSNVKGQVPSAVPMGQEAVPLRAEITPTTFGTSDIFEMVIIPPGMNVIDWAVDVDDLDSDGSPAAVFKVGVLNSGKTDLDSGNAIWKTGLTTAQAGGLARMDTKTAIRAGSSTSERVVGIIPTTAAATFQSGTLGITVWCVTA